MTWKAPTCPFCHKRQASKALLQSHLQSYVKEWRIPADGIHDVLQIKQLLDSPISEESVEAQQQTKPFPFLSLPYDVRHIFYRFVLTAETITFYGLIQSSFVTTKTYYQNIYLQHNPISNPLAILITNRQIYNEARQVLYSRNTFVFLATDFLPIFLVGIGRHNAELLRSVRWRRTALPQGDNQIGMIQPWLDPSSSGRDLWSDELAYAHFLGTFSAALDLSRLRMLKERLLRRPNGEGKGKGWPERFTVDVAFGEMNGSVTYELWAKDWKDSMQ
ncbi:hypothetical protein BO94DRAFT_585886 [Aspergillus sclerotioniger CBS 115572]|uniref:Uncharacterized protein n=1 Tax=Aspergillus sclerotioniger CBS 115572 TaxID=1450535 RepID=A0A317WQZ3_9EURO|nr:hypothetical protein BO94DRAFT_585886 [Aspergillus sclerotioniger CBS 115572]PWY87338.1 hypothetical protein BO94DRAFT_585886 [Aspergillus sclerotioniger CBS 115572]